MVSYESLLSMFVTVWEGGGIIQLVVCWACLDILSDTASQ